ncbi:MAG: transposase [Isosphaeraceae bacterium]|nr:transposase [Isosphaeraceae bacterium]
MSRPLRNADGGLIYHALNRSNARLAFFNQNGDYEAFLGVLTEAVDRHGTRLLAYCVMPDHFHLVLWPEADGELSQFTRWLTMTHTQRWHAARRSAGAGRLYEGRFKSFPVQNDGHFLTVCCYVERNALRAGLVRQAESWRWGSLAQRMDRSAVGPALSPWPVRRPSGWLQRVNAALGTIEEDALRRCVIRGQPYGTPQWQAETASRLGLELTLRPRRRPKKKIDGGT